MYKFIMHVAIIVITRTPCDSPLYMNVLVQICNKADPVYQVAYLPYNIEWELFKYVHAQATLYAHSDTTYIHTDTFTHMHTHTCIASQYSTVKQSIAQHKAARTTKATQLSAYKHTSCQCS